MTGRRDNTGGREGQTASNRQKKHGLVHRMWIWEWQVGRKEEAEGLTKELGRRSATQRNKRDTNGV